MKTLYYYNEYSYCYTLYANISTYIYQIFEYFFHLNLLLCFMGGFICIALLMRRFWRTWWDWIHRQVQSIM